MKETYSKEMNKMLHKFNEVDAKGKRLSVESEDKNEENMLLRQ